MSGSNSRAVDRVVAAPRRICQWFERRRVGRLDWHELAVAPPASTSRHPEESVDDRHNARPLWQVALKAPQEERQNDRHAMIVGVQQGSDTLSRTERSINASSAPIRASPMIASLAHAGPGA